ncbi:MAG: tetratricopeptide repeat protein [Actinobacteria bacterium]|nr:MAG: tetratricopeptide repeat protein [Actinomycetota bacterium]
MRKRTIVVAIATLTAAAVSGGIFGVRRTGDAIASHPSGDSAVSAATATGLARASGASIEQTIANLQDHLTKVPNDYPAWATLGLAYVQQAKITVNSDYYPKAQGSFEKSLSINDIDNFLAYAGLSALASARHDFATAEAQARKGLALNPSSAVLYGALGDALVQLGRYAEADDAIAKMASLRPDTSSYARQSYLRELRGDISGARTLMQQALNVAPTPSDRAFALFYLGELDYNSGDVNAALTNYRRALAASPTDIQSLAGKAKAEAALGQHLTAIDDYTTVVSRAPEPGVVLEFGEFLQSIGRTDEAQSQYQIVDATQRLLEANGVEPDATMTLFYVNRGQPATALANAERGITTRPFLVMRDAYAWALHANGRDTEALTAVQQALALGTRSALTQYHAGMINLSLGNTEAARAELETALTINPFFDPLAVPVARQTLAVLGTSA